MAAESGVQRAAVVTAQVWYGRFGDMLIETCVDGTVWINGEPVAGKRSQPAAVTTPSPPTSAQAEDEAGARPDAAAQDQPYDCDALIQAAEDKAFAGCGLSDWLWEQRVQAYYAGILARAPAQHRQRTVQALLARGYEPGYVSPDLGPGYCSRTGIDEHYCTCGYHL
ncbi:hypothetical protein KAK07_23585 [Ideonella sp. 4Y16]|uniref:Uncharacterized protein n=1 Tax=Ideonella aquatica TaxID=2824119 RepID=A0A941BRI7_9BURK|nr:MULTISPECIES: hypothetical protein [Ideonella]MBQ0946342.1 hypothetical protein [Ideonella alba]MBQ0960450.1 hypothetical protein [Ideonella aquatica]